jgi:hypothetical protein
MPLPNARAGAGRDDNGHKPQRGCDFAGAGILVQRSVGPPRLIQWVAAAFADGARTG